MGIYQSAGLTAQLPVIKPAQKHKYNATTVQIDSNKTLKRGNKIILQEKAT